MMTDYSQIYGTNQVIAKPPVKAHRESLGSAIDSFYSDIASIESSNLETEQPERQEINYPEAVSSPVPQIQLEDNQSSTSDAIAKDRKKKKVKKIKYSNISQHFFLKKHLHSIFFITDQ